MNIRTCFTHRRLPLMLAFLTGLSASANAQLAQTDRVKQQLSVENKDTVAWIRRGILNLGFNEGLLHNWAAGGEAVSLSVDGLFSGSLTRLHHHAVWTNSLDAAYRLYYAYSNAFVPRKLEDRIDFTSKYGTRLDTSNFYLTGLFNFKSQFSRGYDYSVPGWDTVSASRFLSPAYFILAAGAEYRRGNVLTLFLSPAAARVTVASRYYTSRRPEGAFGIAYNEKARFELGAYFSGRYTRDIWKNINFKTRVDLYANYLAKDKKDSLGNVVAHDHPGNVDLLWDNLLTVKAGRYLDLILGLTAIYDNDFPYSATYTDGAGVTQAKNEPDTGLGWWQVKQIFTLGLSVKF